MHVVHSVTTNYRPPILHPSRGFLGTGPQTNESGRGKDKCQQWMNAVTVNFTEVIMIEII